MKFLHSPSSSSSSTSETRSNYAIGCISTILRRLLRFHGLPTVPFDRNVNESNELYDEISCDDDNKLKGNPGVVAKLMGLDSMPIDELGLEKKASCVLKAPSFVELENEKFIILSFEGGGKDREFGLKTRKGFIELKEKRRNKKKQEIPNCQSKQKDDEVCRLFDMKSDFNKNLKKLCDVESDSENSSPVSVLEFPYHQEASSHSGLNFKNSYL